MPPHHSLRLQLERMMTRNGILKHLPKAEDKPEIALRWLCSENQRIQGNIMAKHDLTFNNVTNHDQLSLHECGGILTLRNQKTFNFEDCDKVVLTTDRPKKTHTFHLVSQSNNMWSFLIFISRNTIDKNNRNFKRLPEYCVVKDKLKIETFWHTKRRVVFISTNEKAWMGVEVSKIVWSITLFKPPAKMSKIFTTFDGAPGQVFPVMKQICEKSKRMYMCLAGGTSKYKQANDKKINQTFQRHFRQGVLMRNMKERKKIVASGKERSLTCLTNEELVNIAANAYAKIRENPQITIRSFERSGYCDDPSKWDTFLRESVQNPPKFEDLPDAYKRPYDPTGQNPVRNRSTPLDVVDKYPITCKVCGRYFTYKYSKHVKAHIADCPYKFFLKKWKPTPWGKALFHHRNF